MLGSRLKSGSALAQGMPWWKYVANRFLTGVENRVFGLALSEYHTGYRAFRREVLETVNFLLDSDSFVFDQEIIAQVVAAGFRIAEIPVPTRYFAEASSAGSWRRASTGCGSWRCSSGSCCIGGGSVARAASTASAASTACWARYTRSAPHGAHGPVLGAPPRTWEA